MSNLNILTDNLVKASGVEFSMITGTENANFPLKNLTNNFTTKVFRSLENPCEILVDLKQTRDMDIFCVVGDNIRGLGVTKLSLTFSATTDFTGQTTIEVDLNHDFNFGTVEFAEVSVRYVKITMENTGEYCELSTFYIGKSEKLEFNGFSQDGFVFGTNDFSSVSSNNYGQDFIDIRNSAKILNGNINFANKEEVDILERVYAEHMNRTPLWLIVDSCDNVLTNGKFRLSGYYKFLNRPVFTASGVGLFNTTLNLSEAI